MRYRWRCGGFLDDSVLEYNGCYTRTMYFDVALLIPSLFLFMPSTNSGRTLHRVKCVLFGVMGV